MDLERYVLGQLKIKFKISPPPNTHHYNNGGLHCMKTSEMH